MRQPDRDHLNRLEALPNIGPRIAAKLRQLGIEQPRQLIGEDPYRLYERLNHLSGQRHDPCLLDTFIAAIDFMNGAEARPWWHYSNDRKRRLARGRG